ncbi:hypothetical protein Glove_226g43 [Diversispora epigaea]|uniref:Uncharacterized protein n=1 Tax=Diversispora epigaea TaxID=1348612 RepID=A0A397IHL5_9GLOM|nr:hypothetical protein Glove_226g43 [Diversispora epigaea]
MIRNTIRYENGGFYFGNNIFRSSKSFTNNSKCKIDLCIRTEDGAKELSHFEYAREVTILKILKDRSKLLRTSKCILSNYLENNLPNEALQDTAIFGLQLAALLGYHVLLYL